MWKQPDEKGRYPMSNAEYQALRALFGAKNALEQTSKDIERRMRLIPGGWRDFRMLVSVLDKLLMSVLRTVPQKKNCLPFVRNCPEPFVKFTCRV